MTKEMIIGLVFILILCVMGMARKEDEDMEKEAQELKKKEEIKKIGGK